VRHLDWLWSCPLGKRLRQFRAHMSLDSLADWIALDLPMRLGTIEIVDDDWTLELEKSKRRLIATRNERAPVAFLVAAIDGLPTGALSHMVVRGTVGRADLARIE